MSKLGRRVSSAALALLACVGCGCAKERCKSEAPAFQVTVAVPKAWDGEVTELEVEVILVAADGGAPLLRQKVIPLSKGLLADGSTTFWVTVGSRGAGGFTASVTATAMAGIVARASSRSSFRGNSNACNFFVMALGTDKTDGSLDARGDGPRDLGPPSDGVSPRDLAPPRDEGHDQGPVVPDTSVPKPDVQPACPDTQKRCNGVCVDTQTSPDHCGDCNVPCGGQRLCVGGQCFANGGCAAGVAGGRVQKFSDVMWGCGGQVTQDGRATLCDGRGFRVCTGAEWVNRRGGRAPTYNYWVNEWLQFTAGDPANCYGNGNCATESGKGAIAGFSCTSSPMLVCAADRDPLNNACNCWGCGWGTTGNSQYFGGCNLCGGGNCGTAGALCCR